jgi:hypothetical protein
LKGTLKEMPNGQMKAVAERAKKERFTGCAIQAGRCTFKNGSSTNQVMISSLADLPKLKEVLKKNR